jgi:butyryl-CoA dehydrogenase
MLELLIHRILELEAIEMTTDDTLIEQVRDVFHDFAANSVRPEAAAIDSADEFPRHLWEQAGALGCFGLRYPEEVGGSGLGLRALAVAIEEIAWGSGSLATACLMQSLMATHFLHRGGNAQIASEYLAPAIAGESIGAICMTEPNAGSDLRAISTRARLNDEGNYILNGSKTWVTSALVADFFTVFARGEDSEGLGVFLVLADQTGLSVGQKLDKLGVRGSVTSEVFLDDVVIPASQVLVPLGEGMDALREILVEIRIQTAALALGLGRAALEEALTYAGEREQFGRTLTKFQATRLRLAKVAAELEAARALVDSVAEAAELASQNIESTSQSTLAGPLGNMGLTGRACMAKWKASESALAASQAAMRVLASYGYSTEYAVERILRDSWFTLFGGGTSEMLLLSIARELEM